MLTGMVPLLIAVILWTSGLTVLAEEAETAHTFYTRALQKQEKMNYHSALADFDKAIALDPQFADAYVARGVLKTMRSDLGTVPQAMADFDRAIEINPQLATAYYQRAVMYFPRDNDAAIANCTRAISLEPTFSAAWNARGKARFEKKDYEGARADFHQVLQLDPEMSSAWYYGGLIHQVQGEWEDALADFTHAMKVDPEDVGALEWSRRIRLRQGDLDGALADLDRLFSLRRSYSSAFLWYDRGLIQFMRGDDASAVENFKKVPMTSLGEYTAAFTPIFLWIAQGRMGQMRLATEQLAFYHQFTENKRAEAQKKHGSLTLSSEVTGYMGFGQKPSQIEAFLLGKTSEEDFLAQATQGTYEGAYLNEQGPTRLCQAWYFIGMRHLLAGDKSGAAAFFKKCVGLEKLATDEWCLARAELQKLTDP